MKRDDRKQALLLRRATKDDASRITEIYNEGIRDRIATFETRERSVEEVAEWLSDDRYPLLVAQLNETVVGWAAASQYRPRDCYAGIAEFSIYIDRSVRGKGIGRRLMPAFLEACKEAEFWKVLPRVFPENTASLALLEGCGFRQVGVYRRHAQLDGRWRDVVIVERLL